MGLPGYPDNFVNIFQKFYDSSASDIIFPNFLSKKMQPAVRMEW